MQVIAAEGILDWGTSPPVFDIWIRADGQKIRNCEELAVCCRQMKCKPVIIVSLETETESLGS